MKRSLIATAWVFGTTVPLLAAAVFLFGCCVLPFHGVVHKVMPFCGMAVGLLHHHEAPAPLPARAKQQPAKRIATEVPHTDHFPHTSRALRRLTPSHATAYRSFISLGATRCDQDIGLHLVVETLLI